MESGSEIGAKGPVVLWVSRHGLLPVQEQELKDILGDFTLIQIAGKVPSAEWVIQKAKQVNASIVIPVLPFTIITKIFELGKKKNIETWWAEMEEVKVLYREPMPKVDYDPFNETVVIAAGEHEQRSYKIMRFKQFQRIKGIKVEMEPVKKRVRA